MSHSFIFVTTIGLCALIMVATMATGDRKVPTPLLQVYNGLPVVRNMIWKQLLMYRIPPPPAFELGQRAVCTMFNLYLQFTTALFNIPPDSAIYGNFTGNQFAVWSVMQSACQWVQAKAENATLLNNCTLSEISNMCLNFHLYQIVTNGLIGDITAYIRNGGFDAPLHSANYWINTTLRGGDLHCSAIVPILETYKCNLTTYKCDDD